VNAVDLMNVTRVIVRIMRRKKDVAGCSKKSVFVLLTLRLIQHTATGRFHVIGLS